MRKLISTLTIAAAVVGITPSTSTAQVGEGPGAERSCFVVDVKRAAKRGYPRGAWERKKVTPKPLEQKFDRLLECLETRSDRRDAKKVLAIARTEFVRHRSYRKATSYGGLSGEGYWLHWLAVPAWVVRAETNGYHGEGRWRAQNPSGACGPYQLLGHTSCDTSSPRDKLRHHRVASGLPRGSWAVGYSAVEGKEVTAEMLAEDDVYWWQATPVAIAAADDDDDPSTPE